jgi:hypothetical protein
VSLLVANVVVIAVMVLAKNVVKAVLNAVKTALVPIVPIASNALIVSNVLIVVTAVVSVLRAVTVTVVVLPAVSSAVIASIKTKVCLAFVPVRALVWP